MKASIRILSSLYIAFGILGLIIPITIFLTLSFIGIFTTFILNIVGLGILIVVSVFFIPGIIGGIGLWHNQEWARWLVLILGFINLLLIPFGTVLGIYTIMILLDKEAEFYFANLSQPVEKMS